MKDTVNYSVAKYDDYYDHNFIILDIFETFYMVLTLDINGEIYACSFIYILLSR